MTGTAHARALVMWLPKTGNGSLENLVHLTSRCAGIAALAAGLAVSAGLMVIG